MFLEAGKHEDAAIDRISLAMQARFGNWILLVCQNVRGLLGFGILQSKYSLSSSAQSLKLSSSDESSPKFFSILIFFE